MLMTLELTTGGTGHAADEVMLTCMVLLLASVEVVNVGELLPTVFPLTVH